MSWYADIERAYVFRCDEGHETRVIATDQPEIAPPCAECGASVQYTGFEPIKIGIATKISYDQNGIKAYKIQTGKGSASYMSRTRYEINDKGKINEHYTKERQRATVSKIKKDEV